MDEYPPNPKCVAMEFYKAILMETVGNDLHVTEFQSMDLKGYFPKSLMNKVMAKLVLDQLEKTCDFIR